MRPLPIPDDLLESIADANGGIANRVVIGEPGDPTRTDVRPCEYAVIPSDLYPGRPAVIALVDLEDEERAAIAAGAKILLRLDGGELPWGLSVLEVGS